MGYAQCDGDCVFSISNQHSAFFDERVFCTLGFYTTTPARSSNAESVRDWLKIEYPAIKERARRERGEIFWGDETGLQNECNYVRGYAPKGKTPENFVDSGHKLRVNMMSAITNQGKLRFMIYEGTMSQGRLIEFMRRLIKSGEKKVFLILDNLKVHHGKMVRKWVKKREGKIKVFYLPSYSPERNPDEYFKTRTGKEGERGGEGAIQVKCSCLGHENPGKQGPSQTPF